MKTLPIFLLLLLFFFACHTTDKNRATKEDKIASKNSEPLKIDCDTTKWYLTKKDRNSVLVYNEDDQKAYYKMGELQRILKSYPELNESIPPDQAYAQRGKDGIAPCEPHLYGCELCQDDYYVLYAYFLKQHNGDKKYSAERKQLIGLYRAINFIYGKLAQGGTYFSHQHSRILGYAEYSIYLKKSDTYNDTYNKPYDIAKQKKLYIDGLRQLIIDEVGNNLEISTTEKPTIKKELFKTVDDIDGLITNYFYLTMTQEFQYTDY